MTGSGVAMVVRSSVHRRGRHLWTSHSGQSCSSVRDAPLEVLEGSHSEPPQITGEADAQRLRRRCDWSKRLCDKIPLKRLLSDQQRTLAVVACRMLHVARPRFFPLEQGRKFPPLKKSGPHQKRRSHNQRDKGYRRFYHSSSTDGFIHSASAFSLKNMFGPFRLQLESWFGPARSDCA